METNPAGRLHEILSKAKKSPSGTAFSLWSGVFEVTVESTRARNPLQAELEAQIEVISRIFQFKKLIEDTEESLHRIDGLSEKYFRPFDRIRPLVKQSIGFMNADLSGMLGQITEGDMTVLEFCSERLEGLHSESLVDEKELQSILEDVTTLFDEVKISELDVELKTFILDGLESIRRGIYEFRIRGSQRLKEAIAEIIASFVMNHEITKTPQDQESWARFNRTLKRFVAVVSFAHSGIKLLEAVAGPFLPASPDAPH